MKKSELINIIKEEIQNQMSLKEYSRKNNPTDNQKRHEFNDKTMVDTLRKILAVLQSIDSKTGAK